MAETLGEMVGQTVGYAVRLDRKVSPRTRIEVVTEGILTRMIQSDPELPGVGCLIFDEFHERSLNADLGLALALEIRGALRDDLMLVVMSAGNDGPGPETIGGPADSPWVTSVGANTMTRFFQGTVKTNDGPVVKGASVTRGTRSAAIVDEMLMPSRMVTRLASSFWAASESFFSTGGPP